MQEKKSVISIARVIKSTYSHTIKMIKLLEDDGLMLIEPKNKKSNYIRLSEKGEFVAKRLVEIDKI